jgi:hypothetical protein
MKLLGFNPREKYTNRATAACWRSQCQLPPPMNDTIIQQHMVVLYYILVIYMKRLPNIKYMKCTVENIALSFVIYYVTHVYTGC